MAEAIFLAGLAGLLAGFLFWEKIPRPIAVEVWCNTILVYIVCFGISLEIFDRFADRFEEDILPYLPPVVPAFIFLIWRLHRIQRRR
jgi:hypothetical protein